MCIVILSASHKGSAPSVSVVGAVDWLVRRLHPIINASFAPCCSSVFSLFRFWTPRTPLCNAHLDRSAGRSFSAKSPWKSEVSSELKKPLIVSCGHRKKFCTVFSAKLRSKEAQAFEILRGT